MFLYIIVKDNKFIQWGNIGSWLRQKCTYTCKEYWLLLLLYSQLILIKTKQTKQKFKRFCRLRSILVRRLNAMNLHINIQMEFRMITSLRNLYFNIPVERYVGKMISSFSFLAKNTWHFQQNKFLAKSKIFFRGIYGLIP